MSQAHRGSILAIQNGMVSVPFESLYIKPNSEMGALQYGDLVRPIGNPVYTMTSGNILYQQATNMTSGNLYYPSTTFNPSSFTMLGWFNLTTTATSMGIAGSSYIPIIEYAPTSNRGTTASLSLMVVKQGTPPYQKYSLSVGLSDGTSIISSSSLSANTWYHYGLTFDGTTYTLFLNGASVAQGASSIIATTYTDSVLMYGGGYRSGASVIMGECTIDRIARISDAITAAYYSNIGLYCPYDYREYAN